MRRPLVVRSPSREPRGRHYLLGLSRQSGAADATAIDCTEVPTNRRRGVRCRRLGVHHFAFGAARRDRDVPCRRSRVIPVSPGRRIVRCDVTARTRADDSATAASAGALGSGATRARRRTGRSGQARRSLRRRLLHLCSHRVPRRGNRSLCGGVAARQRSAGDAPVRAQARATLPYGSRSQRRPGLLRQLIRPKSQPPAGRSSDARRNHRGRPSGRDRARPARDQSWSRPRADELAPAARDHRCARTADQCAASSQDGIRLAAHAASHVRVVRWLRQSTGREPRWHATSGPPLRAPRSVRLTGPTSGRVGSACYRHVR